MENTALGNSIETQVIAEDYISGGVHHRERHDAREPCLRSRAALERAGIGVSSAGEESDNSVGRDPANCVGVGDEEIAELVECEPISILELRGRERSVVAR